MGLGFVGAKAHWSYSGFNNFRRKLAMEIGICLDFMDGFWTPGGGRYQGNFGIAIENVGKNIIDKDFFWLPNKPLSWNKIKDPIVDLLNCSDCEGSLSPSQCKKIAPRLKELVKVWSDDYDKIQALLLAEGMEECSKNGKTLEFC